MRRFIVLMVSILTLAGCAFFHHVPEQVSVTPEGPEIKILDATKFAQGQSVFIVPFKAGVNVASTKELDRIALSVVQGLGSSLDGPASPLRLNENEGKETTDLLIQGHITQSISQKSRIPWNAKGQKSLAVEGSIVDRKTRQKLLVFSHKKMVVDQTTRLEDLGVELGEEIGQRLVSTLNR